MPSSGGFDAIAPSTLPTQPTQPAEPTGEDGETDETDETGEDGETDETDEDGETDEMGEAGETGETGEMDDSDWTDEMGEEDTPAGPPDGEPAAPGDVGEPIIFTSSHIQYIFGYPDGSFGPDLGITRAEAATIIHRLADDPGKDSAAFAGGFQDVPADAWYAQPVFYLASKAVMQGYPDGTFMPDARITRAEFATMLARINQGAAQGAAQSNGTAFTDVGADHWASAYISACSASGMMAGYSDGSFRPQNEITRAEAVTAINRMLDRKIAPADIPGTAPSFADVGEGHWAYAAVIEASTTHDFDRKDDGFEQWN